MKVLPIFLNNLEGRRCVVFGGSHEAERKTQDLLACDADVVVISTDVTDRLKNWAEQGMITWCRREYEKGDLRDTFLAIATETNPPKTAPIWEEARREKVLLNAMDDVDHCTFVAGSVIRRGPVVISISTSGTAPALAVRTRQRLEKTFTDSFGSFASLLGSLRAPMQEVYPDFDVRRRLWYALVDSEILPLLEQGNREEVRRILETIVGPDVAAAVPADFDEGLV